jgi:Zn-dependent peptidase ImmA (M78 family)/DNA-binding XRE family transcriptional regulator
MEHFAQRLRMARTMKGWSMQDLSNHLNGLISKQAIGKYENGDMMPEKSTLIALCNILDVKIDFFERVRQVEIQPEFRKFQKLSVRKQNEIIEKTKDYLERYLEAEELTASENVFINPLSQPCKSLEDAEMQAEEFRMAMNIGDNPLHNIAEQLEEWGIKVYREDFDTDDIFGLADWVDDRVAVIVINTQSNIDRQRFTALHELGHLVLNIPNDITEKLKESMCNRFAGAMLISAKQLKNELGPKRSNIHLKELEIIKAQYGISPLATLYRAKDLGIISQYVFIQKIRYIGSIMGNKADIGVFKGSEETNRLLQILCKGIAEEAITSSKAAGLFNMRLAEFRDILTTQKV